MTYKIRNPSKEKKEKNFEIKRKEPEGFSMDFIQAEFTNQDTDIANTWKWKKGQTLYRWTTNRYYKIHKVSKYPKSSIWIIEIDKP